MKCMMTTLIPIPNETGSPSAPPEETSFITSSLYGRAGLPRPSLRYALQALRDYPRLRGEGNQKTRPGAKFPPSPHLAGRGDGEGGMPLVCPSDYSPPAEKRGIKVPTGTGPQPRPAPRTPFVSARCPAPTRPRPSPARVRAPPAEAGRREAAAATSPGASEAGRSRGPSRRHRRGAASPARASTEPA